MRNVKNVCALSSLLQDVCLLSSNLFPTYWKRCEKECVAEIQNPENRHNNQSRRDPK